MWVQLFYYFSCRLVADTDASCLFNGLRLHNLVESRSTLSRKIPFLGTWDSCFVVIWWLYVDPFPDLPFSTNRTPRRYVTLCFKKSRKTKHNTTMYYWFTTSNVYNFLRIILHWVPFVLYYSIFFVFLLLFQR